MVGEPPRRSAPLSWFNTLQRGALRPGKYVVLDKHGRRFTTANDEGYAERLAARLGGTMEEEQYASPTEPNGDQP